MINDEFVDKMKKADFAYLIVLPWYEKKSEIRAPVLFV